MLPMCGTSNVDWKALAQTMYMFGMLLGSGVFGWLGDRVSSCVPNISYNILARLVESQRWWSLWRRWPSEDPFLISSTQLQTFTLFWSSPGENFGKQQFSSKLQRFVSGFGHVGTFMNTFSLAIESVGASHRTLFGILIEVPFSVGGLVACWLSQVSK